MTERLSGKPVADALLAEARAAVSAGNDRGWRPPTLVSVHRASATPFAFYLRQQQRAAEAAGVGFRSVEIDEKDGAAGLSRAVRDLNADPSVDAILVEHPLPEELGFRDAVSLLDPRKDVDGVSPANLGRLLTHRRIQAPAVALAAVAIAHHYHVPLEGRPVAVLGRSETVGLPLTLLLLARDEGANATVTVAHSKTRDLAAVLRGVETIFSCMGQPRRLTRELVPQGATVIDIGLSSVPDPETPGASRPSGDADEKSLEGWAKALTPVPGGVGPVTVAQLLHNVVHGWTLLSNGEPP